MADDNSIWAREQAVAIVVDLRGQFGTGDRVWRTPGYINGSSTGSGRSYWVDGVQSSNPQSLINALAAISSSTTKTTKIEMKWEIPGSYFSGGPRGGSTSEFSTYSTMSVFIDWENMTVTWSGQENSGISTYATFGGKKTISSAGSTVKLDWVPGQNGDGHYRCRTCPGHSQIMVLKTGTNRNITGLPAPIHDSTVSTGAFSSGFTMHGNYMVTTDNGMTVSVAPDAPPVAEAVSGIKISELNAATSLNDTDLFVLSRDQPAGAPYDKSLNVTTEKLFNAITGSMFSISNCLSWAWYGWSGGSFKEQTNWTGDTLPDGTWLLFYFGQNGIDGSNEDDNYWWFEHAKITQEIGGFNVRDWMATLETGSGGTNWANWTGFGFAFKVS